MANEDFRAFSGTNSAEEDDALLSRARDAMEDAPEETEEEVDIREDLASASRAIGSPEATPSNRPDLYQSAGGSSRAYRRVYEEQTASVPFDKPKTMAYSVVALVLSILSVVCCCSGFVSAVFGVVAIVFAIVSRVHLGYFDSMSIVGLILGIIGVVFGVFLGIVTMLGVFTEGKIFDEIVSGDINTQF